MKQRLFILPLIVVTSSFAIQAAANDLTVPFTFPSTGTIPQGIRSVNIQGFSTEVFNKFDTHGNKMSYDLLFSKSVTYNDMIKGLKTQSERSDARAFFEESGNDLNSAVGEATGVFNARATVTVPALAYGLTDQWTLAVAVPVIYSSLNFDSGFQFGPSGNKIMGAMGKPTEGKTNKANEMRAKLISGFATKIAENGYKAPGNRSSTEIGDIVVVNKVQLTKTDEYAIAVQNDLTLPTGRPYDSDSVIDVASGDGQFDIGVSGIADYNITKWLMITGQAGFVAQLPGTAAKRIPVNSESPLTPDVDRLTKTDLGDKTLSNLIATWTLYQGLTAHTGISYQKKWSDHYNGDQFAAERYHLLERNTDQEMQASQLGLGYSTVPLYKEGKVAVPFITKLSHTLVSAGRNVAADSISAFELTLFF